MYVAGADIFRVHPDIGDIQLSVQTRRIRVVPVDIACDALQLLVRAAVCDKVTVVPSFTFAFGDALTALA